MIRYSTLFFCLAIACWSVAQSPLGHLDIPEKHRQVLLVTTNSWSDSTGSLQLFIRDESGWNATSHPVSVVVGRNGLAWGRGLHVSGTPEKVEGDGKAPAGIFELSGSFGYQEQAPEGADFPYRQVTYRDYWVDDVNSADYNQWVNIPQENENIPKERWDSFERMRREDHLYELGIIVNHNFEPVTKGKGSAIFMHVWKGKDAPTAGCTAMPKEQLISIIQWLDQDKNPLLIQVPVGELKTLEFVRP